jgi:hypothetical protein
MTLIIYSTMITYKYLEGMFSEAVIRMIRKRH